MTLSKGASGLIVLMCSLSMLIFFSLSQPAGLWDREGEWGQVGRVGAGRESGGREGEWGQVGRVGVDSCTSYIV